MLSTEIRKITIKEYHKMAEVGIIQPDEKVELINGRIIKIISPVNKRHSSHVKRINQLLSRKLYRKATIGVQDPILIPFDSEPEPDISVLKYSEDQYADGHPLPEDVYILIEVSDSTLKRDKTEKLELYASANIPEYWVINLIDNCVEVFQNPKDNFYQKHLMLTSNDILNLPFEKTLKVSDILK